MDNPAVTAILGGLIVLIAAGLAAQYSKRALWLALGITVPVYAVLFWDDTFKTSPGPVVTAVLLSASGVFIVASLVFGVRAYLKRRTKRPKGRKGVLNLQVDIPKIMISVDQRAGRLGDMAGQLSTILKGRRKSTVDSDRKPLKWANGAAAVIGPIAQRMKKEALGFHADATELSGGLSRWLEVAEREGRPLGLGEQVPNLITLAKKSEPLIPTIKSVRRPYEQLRGLADTLDAACGELVEALDSIMNASHEMATACRSSLLRIKKLLEDENRALNESKR